MIKALYKPVILLALSVVIQNCSKSDNYDNNCNNLLNLGIQTSLNLNLAQYNQLTFPSNPVYVPNEGNGGLIVNNTGTGYVAFDAADPNIPFGECSILTISGVEAINNCSEFETHRYSLFTGQPLQNPDLRCNLRPYFIELIGNEIFISN
jgi:hypothetical protein